MTFQIRIIMLNIYCFWLFAIFIDFKETGINKQLNFLIRKGQKSKWMITFLLYLITIVMFLSMDIYYDGYGWIIKRINEFFILQYLFRNIMNQQITSIYLWMGQQNTILATQQTSQNLNLTQIEVTYQTFYRLYLQNQTLKAQLSNIKHQKILLQQENQSLYSHKMEMSMRSKRKYTKRRTWLDKEFNCPYSECQGKYSSKIALNNHLRKKHPLSQELQ